MTQNRQTKGTKQTFGATVRADVPTRLPKTEGRTGGYHVAAEGDPSRAEKIKKPTGNAGGNAGGNADGKGKKRDAFGQRVFYEDNTIFWCDHCHVPLIGETCGLCGAAGREIVLSQPADVRFAHAYDARLIGDILTEIFSCNPLAGKTLLLNKIPGDDWAAEILVESAVFGILRFDLKDLCFKFELAHAGAKILLSPPWAEKCAHHTVRLKKAKNHLNGKNLSADQIESFPTEIKAGDPIIIVSGNLTGCGTALVSGEEFEEVAAGLKNAPSSSLDVTLREHWAAVRIKTVSSDAPIMLPEASPTVDDITKANVEYIRKLGKNAINTVKGFVNLKENRQKPVYVSFSGGKDSLVALDLTVSALSDRPFSAVFLNTGVDYPETVAFARSFCADNNIPLIEKKAGDAFWNELRLSDHPTKDNRWCCKVCKLNSSNDLAGGREHISIDGKRRHESFVRATIPASDRNPKVPGQTNIFPIRDWRAIEVWMYIHWRGLKYNPLYDEGFERIGCWMCPAAFQAEYVRTAEIHPELAARWDDYLDGWARKNKLKKEYLRHGLWRWETLPPKMLRLADDLNIKVRQDQKDDKKTPSAGKKKEMKRHSGNKQGRPTMNRIRENVGRR